MLRFLLLLALFYTSVVAAQKNAEKKYLKTKEARMVYLDSGMVHLGHGNQDVVALPVVSAKPERFSVGAFYIGAYEVSNLDYLEYLYFLRNTNMVAYTTALPDTTVWIKTEWFGNKYLAYYLRHPAYNHYPVVGVTHQQAARYCDWLTDRYNENPDRKQKKYAFDSQQKTNGCMQLFRVPTTKNPKKEIQLLTFTMRKSFVFPGHKKLREDILIQCSMTKGNRSPISSQLINHRCSM